MNELLQRVVYTSSTYQVTLGSLLGCVLATITVIVVTRLLFILFDRYSKAHRLETKIIKSIRTSIIALALIIWIILCALSLRVHIILWSNADQTFAISFQNILIVVGVLVMARIADRLISARLIEEFESQTDKDIYYDQYGRSDDINITLLVRNVILILTAYIIVHNSDFNFSLPFGDSLNISVAQVLLAILALFIGRLLLWIIINLLLHGWYKSQKIDLGKQYAYNQLLSYSLYSRSSVTFLVV